MTGFSHVDETGKVRMVDVGAKPVSRRRACARASVLMQPETVAQLTSLPKGDALTTAQIAGVMAAKRTSELIPLCHPLPLSFVDVDVAILENRADVTSTVETTAQTGVEMEALVAATTAALTIYDMAKAVDDSMVVSEVRLLEKIKDVDV
jgi:cyclic pyranopterin monophosphate synthase